MDLDVVIAVLFNQGNKTVWFYEAEDSTGAKAFQLLNQFGDELAWRWITDGVGRWRNQTSLLPSHNVLPDDATEFNLPSERLQLLTLDATNGSSGQRQPAQYP